MRTVYNWQCNMGFMRNLMFIFILVAVLANTLGHAFHEESLQNQIRIHRQAVEDAAPEEVVQEIQEPKNTVQENSPPEDAQLELQPLEDGQANEEQASAAENQHQDDITEDNNFIDLGFPFWTTCNYTVDPIKSCYDCNRLLICKRVGGLVKRCGNPFRPHCNNGTCSPIPSTECA